MKYSVDFWKVVKHLFSLNSIDELYYDDDTSKRAGYPVYRSKLNYNHYVCDLNARYEVVLGLESINFWIED